jgi:chloramphenicol 3-O-phosphotransferase
MRAVVVTGPPGAGKTSSLIALSDLLVEDRVPHAAVDVDEIAWSYPFPDLAGRCGELRSWSAERRARGCRLALVAEVVESEAHGADVLAAIGADEHLLVALHASPATLRDRIVAREPPGWRGLERLLAEAARYAEPPAGAHLVLDTERLTTAEVAREIRAPLR